MWPLRNLRCTTASVWIVVSGMEYAEPALLSRCIEGSDVLNASGMHTKFTCILWIYRSCPISKLSGCVSQLIGIEAEQCHERLQHATCISAPQVSYAGKPYKISDSASHNSTHVYVYMYMHYDYKCNSYAYCTFEVSHMWVL